MLNSKQRSFLRNPANAMPAIFQIGKGGLSEMSIRQFDEALAVRELIKASVLETSPEEPREVAEAVAEAVGADVVQVIGRKFVLYRPAEKPVIELPRARK